MDRHGLVCRTILEHPKVTQRELGQILDFSLGTVNSLVKECAALQYIIILEDGSYQVTEQGMRFLEQFRVDGAVIIAAGFGSRFVPLTFETPKGLLEVFGERMIERQIKQLHEVGIHDITIVVGYLKEKFEYLIDKYQVNLLYNKEYSAKNTLTTIYHARKVLKGKNMYLLSSDNWMRENMFHTYECGSWYSSVFKEGETSEWCLSFNKKGKIQRVTVGGKDSWVMYGPVFLTAAWLDAFLPVLEAYYRILGTEQFYWENVYLELLNGIAQKRLMDSGFISAHGAILSHADSTIPADVGSGSETSGVSEGKISAAVSDTPDNRLSGHSGYRLADLPEAVSLYINRQPSSQVYEFENLEELRVFDAKYQNHSDNQALELISSVFQVEESEIHDIRCLKAGMTNKSFLFQIGGTHYICRIPGPGTELLINRKQEGDVFKAVAPLNITEKVIYFNQETGYKIAEYYEGARNADAANQEEIRQCMALLRRLHNSGVSVSHCFDIRERILFYENLCRQHGGIPFEDYSEVREWMNILLDRLEQLNRPKTISHIDSVADNFLFLADGSLKLIDWEYSGMCDPLIDVAMCAIYSYYNEEEVDWLTETYLQQAPTDTERMVVYSYVALGGFLWSLWAVYKSALGEEFGEYTIIMYRYAKQYYRKIFHKL